MANAGVRANARADAVGSGAGACAGDDSFLVMDNHNEIELSHLVGKRVRVKKNQPRISGDKCPGRFGIVKEVDTFIRSEPLLYVQLEPTARAKARVDTFWLSFLIFLDDEA